MNSFLLLMFTIASVGLLAMLIAWVAIPAFGKWLVTKHGGKEVEE